MHKFILLIILMLLPAVRLCAQMFIPITAAASLSSESVFCLHQDRNGQMWAGTYDGLNVLEGSSCRTIPSGSESTMVSGSQIESIQAGEGPDMPQAGAGFSRYVWIKSNWGFDRYDKLTSLFEHHNEFHGSYHTAVKGATVLVQRLDGHLYFYNWDSHHFVRLGLRVPYEDTKAFFFTDERHVEVILNNCVAQITLTDGRDGQLVAQCTYRRHGLDVWYATAHGQRAFLVDTQHRLYEWRGGKAQPRLLHTFSPAMSERGDIACIVPDGRDLLVGFCTNGLVELVASATGSYAESPLPVHSGVNAVARDVNQKFLWIATDGEGLLAWAEAPYVLHNHFAGRKGQGLNKPVRAFYLAPTGDLWAATKGDGIYIYRNFLSTPLEQPSHKLDNANSGLPNNSVYCLVPGRGGVLWIGTDAACPVYYSFASRSFHPLPLAGHNVSSIHSMVEVAGKELWVATGSQGLYMLQLGGVPGQPKVTGFRRFLYKEGGQSSYNIISLAAQGDSVVWAGARESGLFRYDRRTGVMRAVALSPDKHNPLNDIVTLTALPSGQLLCGTRGGLVLISMKGGRQGGTPVVTDLTKDIGLSYASVRSITTGAGPYTWVTTAHDLLRIDLRNSDIFHINLSSGTAAKEFSESAGHYITSASTLLEGGSDGFISLHMTGKKFPDYKPDLYFSRMEFAGKDHPIRTLMRDSVVTLRHDENDITVYYYVPDFIHSDNYVFQYRLEGYSDNWQNNGRLNRLSLYNLSPGKYRLAMKYMKGGHVSREYHLDIRILPPWWATWWAILLWLAIAGVAATWAGHMIWLRRDAHHKLKAQEAERKQQKDIYDSKFSFLTGIIREFTLPLGLISGAGRRILSLDSTNSKTRGYIGLIIQNSTRLNDLVNQIFEFRRLDTQSHNTARGQVNVSQLVDAVWSRYEEIATDEGIHMSKDVPQRMVWNTDSEILNSILSYLVSFSFSRVGRGGHVTIAVTTTAKQLSIKLTHDGRPLADEKLREMMSWSNIERDMMNNGATRQNKLHNMDLVISHGLTEAISGKMDATCDGSLTTLTVTLPPQAANILFHAEAEPELPTIQTPEGSGEHHGDEAPTTQPSDPGQQVIDLSKVTIYVAVSNRELAGLLHDYLKDDYNVVLIQDMASAELAIHPLGHNAIVLADLESQPVSGLQLCQSLKGSSATAWIPVIIQSSVRDEHLRFECTKAGADTVLFQPYELDYLRSVIQNILERNSRLKEYYNSMESVVEWDNGKIVHREDKEFLEKIRSIISKNLTNPNLTTTFVAEEMGMSVRNLYRKMKELTSETPKDIILQARLNMAQSLFTKSNITVEEVCYQSGFTNRSTFYKAFQQRFKTTPRQYRENLARKGGLAEGEES